MTPGEGNDEDTMLPIRNDTDFAKELLKFKAYSFLNLIDNTTSVMGILDSNAKTIAQDQTDNTANTFSSLELGGEQGAAYYAPLRLITDQTPKWSISEAINECVNRLAYPIEGNAQTAPIKLAMLLTGSKS
jgi:hypothetical protein